MRVVFACLRVCVRVCRWVCAMVIERPYVGLLVRMGRIFSLGRGR